MKNAKRILPGDERNNEEAGEHSTPFYDLVFIGVACCRFRLRLLSSPSNLTPHRWCVKSALNANFVNKLYIIEIIIINMYSL